jgi:serine/threonine protein kinase
MQNRVDQQFGKYRLLRLLGHGGFAEVYLGQHIHLESLAAVKILNTPVNSQMFSEEARILAKLEHEHIVRVIDYDFQVNIPFLVMEYAPHGTMRSHYPQGRRLEIFEIRKYVSQVASALQYAHDQNVLHHDIKPENMLFGTKNEVLLSDFGLAVVMANSSTHYSKSLAGTAIYMAPEQIEGATSPASDQYALGIVVYEWFCGEPPFRGSIREIIGQHLGKAPPYFGEKDISVSLAVEAVVRKALAKEPEQRFASVQEFALAFQGSLQCPNTDISTGTAQDDQSLAFPLPELFSPMTHHLEDLPDLLVSRQSPLQPKPDTQQRDLELSPGFFSPVAPTQQQNSDQQRIISPHLGVPTQSDFYSATPGPVDKPKRRALNALLGFFLVLLLGSGVTGVYYFSQRNSLGTAGNSSASRIDSDATATAQADTATATTFAQASATANALPQIYYAKAPGPGCDKGSGQWTLTTGEIICEANGTLFPVGGSSEGYFLMNFGWPGHSFPQAYTLNVTVTNPTPHTCVDFWVRRTISTFTGYGLAVCAHGSVFIDRNNPAGNPTVLTGGQFANVSTYFQLTATVNGPRLTLDVYSNNDDHTINLTTTDSTYMDTDYISLEVYADAGTPSAELSEFRYTSQV